MAHLEWADGASGADSAHAFIYRDADGHRETSRRKRPRCVEAALDRSRSRTSTRSRAPDFVAKFSEQTMAKVGNTPKMKKPDPYFAKRAPIVSLAIGSEDCDGLDIRQPPALAKHPSSARKGRRLVNITRYQRPLIGGSYQGLGGGGPFSGRLNRLERYRYFALHPSLALFRPSTQQPPRGQRLWIAKCRRPSSCKSWGRRGATRSDP